MIHLKHLVLFYDIYARTLYVEACAFTSLPLAPLRRGKILGTGRGTLSGPESVLLSTFGNELSKETHMLRKQETLLGRGAWVESSRVREPRRTALPRGSQSQVLR